MKNEVYEIPYRAELCYRKNKGVILPENVPYIGMGASNIATNAFRYLEINIFPEKAAEYYNYLIKYKKPGNGVLISQSGQSSETLWCADYFKSFVAIVNNNDTPLGNHPNCKKQICLYSGTEDLVPTKTYINTLLVLYLGFGFNPGKVIDVLKSQMNIFEQTGNLLGEHIYKKVRRRKNNCIYILGNGPNIATANLAALVLSEVTKIPVHSMSVSQYDHGYKETAKNSLVITLNHEGPEYNRTKDLLNTIRNAGAAIFELDQPLVDSIFSPLTFPLPIYFAAAFLSDKLKIKKPFVIGNKITRVTPNSR
ncbi:MAG: hypothetical protein ABFS16_06160 [Bacteroidota bacterium]